MAEAARKDIDRIFAEGKEIDEAVKRAVREAVLRHKQAGNPVVTWRDGKIVWLQPDEIDAAR